MISKKWCLIFLVIIINFHFVICESCWINLFTEGYFFCYQSNKTETCTHPVPNVTNVELDKKDGTVNIEFDNEFNCDYIFRLVYCKDKNNEKCSIHSDYEYMSEKTNEISDQHCQKRGIITLKYIFTGYYTLQWKRDRYDSYNDVLKQQYFETSYEKEDFSNNKMDIIVQHRHINSTLMEIKHPFIALHPTVIVDISEKSINFDAEFTLIPIMQNSYSSDISYSTCLTRMPNYVNISCTAYRTQSIVCEIQGLKIGVYTITALLRDIHQCPTCDNCGLWTHCASRVNDANVTNIPQPKFQESTSSDESDYSILYYLTISVICIGSISIIALITYRCRGELNSESWAIKPNLDEEALIGQTKVFLLYPKDDEIVMKTMETFRCALKAEGFEVYDIYDPDQQKFIDENNINWITDKLSDKNMKTIIPLTYCGQIVTDFPDSAEKIYRKPSHYDSLFPYAISLISAKVDPNSYTKLFIVDMGFDKMEYTKFCFLNPSTRYGLPIKFKELVRDLHYKKGSLDNICQNCNLLNEFIRTHEEMLKFVTDLNYLCNILKVTVVNNNIQIQAQNQITV